MATQLIIKKPKHSIFLILNISFLFFYFFTLNQKTTAQNIPESGRKELLQNNELYEIFIDDGRKKEAAMLLAKSAVVYWNYGSSDSALIFFQQSADIFYDIEAYEELKSIYTNIGAVYLEKKDYKRSVENYEKSLKIAKELGDYSQIAIKMIDLSNAYSMNGNSETALNIIDQAMDIAENESEYNIVLSCYNQMAEVYRNSGEKWKAKESSLRFNHYRDSLEGYNYDLNKLLAEERKKFTEQEVAEVTKKKSQETKVNLNNENMLDNDFLLKKKNAAFAKFSSAKDEEYTHLDSLQKSAYNDTVYRQVDVEPGFPGGVFGFKIFLANSLKFSQQYLTKQKDSIVAEIIVNKYGYVSNPVLKKGIRKVVDDEAIKVLNQMPIWLPAKRNNKEVNAYTTVVIHYPFPDVQELLQQRLKKLEKNKDNVEKGMGKDSLPSYYLQLGNLHFYLKENEKALEYYLEALDVLKENKDDMSVSDVLFNIGNIYHTWVRYKKALDYYLQSLQLKNEINDIAGSGKTLYQIGQLYYEMADTVKAIEYYEKSMEIDKKLGNKQDEAVALNNLGIVYFTKNQLDKALKYYNQALQVYNELNNQFGSATTLNNIGNVQYELKKYKDAISSYENSIREKENIKYFEGIAVSLYNIGNAFMQLNEFQKAIDKYNESIEISKEYLFNEIASRNYEALAEAFAEKDDCSNTLKYHKLYAKYRFYVPENEKRKQLSEFQTKYVSTQRISNGLMEKISQLEQANILKDMRINRYLEEMRQQKLLARLQAEKSSQQIALLNKEKELQQKEISRKRVQRNGLIAVLALMLVILAITYYFFKLIKKKNVALTQQQKDILEKNNLLVEKNEHIEAQNEEIQAQRDSLAEQNKQIAFQHKEIVDSITYAQRIQNALLPKPESLKSGTERIFVLFKPKDIVSGDFYWITEHNDKLIVIGADCTGHGVPGSFMSILGINLLHEIIKQKNIVKSSEILNQLRKHIIGLLKQKNEKHDIQDGMDMSVCVYDKKKGQIEIAAANQRIYMFLNEELVEYKGDKMPVGQFIRMDDFTSTKYEVKKGDSLYLFSDGYVDQFGGKEDKKMKYKDFKLLIEKANNMPTTARLQYLEDSFNKWKGNNIQIDDVMIIGVNF